MFIVMVAGVVIPPEARTNVSPKVGFRGSTPGSRECGAVNFSVFTSKLPPQLKELFLRGVEVTIEHATAGRIFTGIITNAKQNELMPVVDVEATETMAALSGKHAGLMQIGTILNPDLEVYTKEWTILRLNHYRNWDGVFHDEERAVKVFEVLPLSAFESDERAADYGYSRDMIFDSYLYSVENDKAYRSMLWSEWRLDYLAEQVRRLSLQQNGPDFSTGYFTQTNTLVSTTDIWADAVNMQMSVRDEDGNALRGDFVEERGGDSDPLIPAYVERRGLAKRTIDNVVYCFYWEVRRDPDSNRVIDAAEQTVELGMKLHLWQLMNHSRARKLGTIPISYEMDMRNYGMPLHDEGHAPFEVPVNALYPWILSFYAIGGRTGGIPVVNPSIERKWSVIEIDLRQPGNLDGEAEIIHRQLLFSEEVADVRYRYVVQVSAAEYALSTAAQPMNCYELRPYYDKVNGSYQFVPGGPSVVMWNGNVFLQHVAVDMRGKNLRDILHQMCLIWGADWWISAAGVMRMERLKTTPRAISVRAAEFMQHDTNYGEVQESQIEELDGIEIDAWHQRRLKEQLRLLTTSAESGVRKEIEIVPTQLLINLGAKLKVNDLDMGRLVAVTMKETGTVLYETEPV
jgi:hypothetical protein